MTIANVLRPGDSAKSNRGRSGGAGSGAGGVRREAAGYVARLAATRCRVAAAWGVVETSRAGVRVGSTVTATAAGAGSTVGVSTGGGVFVGTTVGVSVGCAVAVGAGSGVPV